MDIYTIYKATNKINNKVYIGFTQDFMKRLKEHRNDHKNINHHRYNVLFYKALRKYKWENFEWEIIYQSKDLIHSKNEMENYFIEEYKSFVGFKDCNGYNMTLGGEGSHGYKHSEKDKQKMSELKKGKFPEHLKGNDRSWMKEDWFREKMSIAHKGKVLLAKTRKKMSEAKTKNWIVIFPDGTKTQIRNLREFCLNNKLSESKMYSVSSGDRSHHKGYKCQKAEI